jgi:hypothetical protein
MWLQHESWKKKIRGDAEENCTLGNYETANAAEGFVTCI